jgi:DNA-directed RNA polymerase specialized sigma24 family protein
MLHEAAPPVTADEVVRRMLVARLDDAYRLAAFILHDGAAAEDAVQQAALLAWDRRRSLRDIERADGWFTRILVNVCRDELRRRAGRPRLVTLDPVISAGLGTVATAGIRSGDPDLGPALARLRPDEQAVLALRFGREFSVPRIAEVLGIPEGTVKSRLHAGLRHLRAALDAERRTGEGLR